MTKPDRPALRQLVEQWRKKAAHIATVHATMSTGYTSCADELEAALLSDAETGRAPEDVGQPVTDSKGVMPSAANNGLRAVTGDQHPVENTEAVPSADLAQLREALEAIVEDAVGEHQDALWIVRRDLIVEAARVLVSQGLALAAETSSAPPEDCE